MDKQGKQAVVAAKWEQLIQACQSSSLTISEFAREHQVGQGSLYTWAKRLGVRLKQEPQTGIGFVELRSLCSPGKDTEVYPIELGVNHLTIKAELPWFKLVELIKTLG